MDTTFSSKSRSEILNEMQNETFDILIIGGGITGAGIALDAVTRGCKTALVEMQDFAEGTSSRSTKLIHGGLRYLKQFEFKLVAEVGKEREIVYENGPHVTTPEWMLLPIHKGGTFGRYSTSIGLKLYDFLAGVHKKEHRIMLSALETSDKEPLLKKEGLKGSGYYVEYRTDDARLTIEVLKKAVEEGALAVNYAKVDNFIYEDNQVTGVKIVDQLTGEQYEVFASKIINATGPWVDRIREKDGSKKGKQLRLSKGVHVVIDQSKFPLKQAIYYDTPDGRMVFAIPRDGKTYVGTTDTFYQGDPANLNMTVSDRNYLINSIHYMFPNVNISEIDIESSWAGVRPLIYEEGKDPSEISRKDEIWVSNSGLITIAGGKLTGYRKMAELVLDLVSNQNKTEGLMNLAPCTTKELPISGGDVGRSKGYLSFIKQKTQEGSKIGLTEQQAKKLVSKYGSNIDKIYEFIVQHGNESADYELPVDIFATIFYGIEYEMVAKPTDYFIRRTGTLYFDINWVHTWKRAVIQCMASMLSWDPEQITLYSTELEKSLVDAVTPLPD